MAAVARYYWFVVAATILNQVHLSWTQGGPEGSGDFCYKQSDARQCEGKEAWPEQYCKAGKMQSPVIIPPSPATPKDIDFLLDPSYSQGIGFKFINTGTTAEIEIDDAEKLVMTGPVLRNVKYRFWNLHFHWGSTNNVGPEHRIDSAVNGSIEAHFVHFGTKFKDLPEAVKSNERNALLVLGIIFVASGTTNSAFNPLVQLLNAIKKPDDEVKGKGLVLKDLIGGDFKGARYNGSLTTPNCNEVVLWNVCTEFRSIGNDQLAMFRTLEAADGTPLVDNYRDTQPLNGRTIEYFNYKIRNIASASSRPFPVCNNVIFALQTIACAAIRLRWYDV